MSGLCYKGHMRTKSPGGSIYCPTCHKDFKKRNYSKYKSQRHPLWDRYLTMLARCYNPNNKSYHRYGGRPKNPIKVCDRWLGPDGFKHFVEDMYPKYKPGLTLDRENNNGDYDPDNCRWATQKEQNNNRSDNLDSRLYLSDDILIESEDKLISLVDFGNLHDIPLIIVKYRYGRYKNFSYILDDTIEKRKYFYKNHAYTMTELGMFSGIHCDTLIKRININGWSVDMAVETPIQSKFSTKGKSNKQQLNKDDPTTLPEEDVYGRLIDNFTCNDVAVASDNEGYYEIHGTLCSDDPDLTDDEIYAITKTRDYILNKILPDTDRDPCAIDLPRG